MKVERIVPILVLVLVAAGVIAAFRIIGSPQHARDVTLDAIRAGDLAAIAAALHDKYAPAKLPSTLAGSLLKRDPVTHEFYDYQRSSASSYVLCATFAAESTGDVESARPYVMYPNTSVRFRHGAGHTCYRLNVTEEPPEPHVINRNAPSPR